MAVQSEIMVLNAAERHQLQAEKWGHYLKAGAEAGGALLAGRHLAKSVLSGEGLTVVNVLAGTTCATLGYFARREFLQGSDIADQMGRGEAAPSQGITAAQLFGPAG